MQNARTSHSGYILLMGKTGCGKSSFINGVLGQKQAPVSDSIDAHTTQVSGYTLRSVPSNDGTVSEIRLVDTPGFDVSSEDAQSSPVELINAFINNEANPNAALLGIIYLQSIIDDPISTVTRKKDLKAIYERAPKLVVATTFWDQMDTTSTEEADAIESEAHQAEVSSPLNILRLRTRMETPRCANSGLEGSRVAEVFGVQTPKEIVERLWGMTVDQSPPVQIPLNNGQVGQGANAHGQAAAMAQVQELQDQYSMLFAQVEELMTGWKSIQEDLRQTKDKLGEVERERDSLKASHARLEQDLQKKIDVLADEMRSGDARTSSYAKEQVDALRLEVRSECGRVSRETKSQVDSVKTLAERTKEQHERYISQINHKLDEFGKASKVQPSSGISQAMAMVGKRAALSFGSGRSSPAPGN